MDRSLATCIQASLQRAHHLLDRITRDCADRYVRLSAQPRTEWDKSNLRQLRLSGRRIQQRFLGAVITIQRAWCASLRSKARSRRHEECRLSSILGGTAGHLYVGGLAGPGTLAASIRDMASDGRVLSLADGAALFARRWRLLRALYLLKRACFCPQQHSK